MELDFGDGKTNPISADNLSKDISKPISFWDIFNIDKNGKNVYPQVAEALINTGDEYMDWQTAAHYAPRLNLDVKRLRQEMRLAQKRNNSSGKYFLPKLPTYEKDGKTFKIPLPPSRLDAPRAYHGSKKKYDFPNEEYIGSSTKNLGYIGMGYYGHPVRYDALNYAMSGSKSLYSFEMLPEGQTLNSHLLFSQQHPSIQKNLEKLFETKVSGSGQKLKDLWAKFYTENPTRYADEMLLSDNDIYRGQINPDFTKNIGNKIYMGLVNLYSKRPVEKLGYLYVSPDNIVAASTVNKMLNDRSIKGAISAQFEQPKGRFDDPLDIEEISPEVVIFDFDEIRDFRSEGNKLFMPAAFHGTPHTLAPEAGAPLGRFRTSKIGTGEGAQAYGHGLYFASKKEVAEYYRNDLYKGYGEKTPNIITHEIDLLLDFATGGGRVLNAKTIISKIKSHAESLKRKNAPWAEAELKTAEKTLRLIEKGDITLGDKGSLYKVELAPKENEYLYYDKTLGEQPKGVQDKLKKFLLEQDGEDLWKYRKDMDYRELRDNVLEDMPEPEISKRLKEFGIPGIKYLDGLSREIQKGSYDYVIFDEADVTVTDKLFMPASEAGAGKGKQPTNRIQQQAPSMPSNRFMAPAASAGAKLSERFGK